MRSDPRMHEEPAMSAITITAAPVLPRTRLRLTARGRRVLALLAALPAVVALAFALLAGGSALAGEQGGAPAGSFETVTVQPGDTLWSIAADVAPHADPRDVVSDIARLNSIDAGSISVGEELAIPAEYSTR
jgi:Tfp pilus assembly protein FimV